MTIKQRQHLLAYLGYYVGNVDGVWGGNALQDRLHGIPAGFRWHPGRWLRRHGNR